MKIIYKFIIGILLFFVFQIVNIIPVHASSEVIDRKGNSVLLWNGTNLVFEKGEDRVELKKGVVKKDAILTSTGDSVIFSGGCMKLYMYNHQNKHTEIIIPNYNQNADLCYDNFKKNDTGQMLAVFSDLEQRSDVIVYELDALESFFESYDFKDDPEIYNHMDDKGLYFFSSDIIGLKNKFHQYLQKYNWKTNYDLEILSNNMDDNISTIWVIDAKTKTAIITKIDPPSPFPDLKPDDPDYGLILKWQKEGWLKGDADGNLNLDKAMTRRNMMEFSYLINIPAIPADAVWPCSDLDIKDTLAPLFFQGFKDGLQLIGGNKCAPEEPVTRLEVISMIFSGFEYEPAKIDCQDRWPDYADPMLPNAPYAALAKNNNLFGKDAVKLEPNKTMTKREAIKLDQLVVDESIGGYNNPHVIPCDIDKYAKEYTWDPESAVSKLLFRRKLMKWSAIGIVSVLGLGGIVYGIIRRRKKVN